MIHFLKFLKLTKWLQPLLVLLQLRLDQLDGAVERRAALEEERSDSRYEWLDLAPADLLDARRPQLLLLADAPLGRDAQRLAEAEVVAEEVVVEAELADLGALMGVTNEAARQTLTRELSHDIDKAARRLARAGGAARAATSPRERPRPSAPCAWAGPS